MKSNMKERFKSVDFISCTCDMWSHDYRTFIAMKSHYIDVKTGALISDMLAIRRMYSKDHVAVKAAIIEILDEYEIREKTVSITTDNASELRCAFNKYSENFDRFKKACDSIEFDLGNDDDDDTFLINAYMARQEKLAEHDNESDTESGDESETEMIRESERIEPDENILPMADDVANRMRIAHVEPEASKFVVHDLESIFRAERDLERGCEDYIEPELEFPLPSRTICNPHTLNLVGKNDLFEALSNEDFANQYFETFERVNQLWNTANKSNNNVQTVRKLIGKKIQKPHKLRWNRIYDAVRFFIYIQIIIFFMLVKIFSLIEKNF